MSEHDFEPIRGLPGNLPAGERLLWQGAPDWWALAQRAFHLRSVAIYFAILIVWRGVSAAQQGASAEGAVQAALWLIPVALLALGLLAGLAALAARTSVYTITTKRVVLRVGMALPKAINIPFTIIENAALRAYSDKTGDVALTLTPPNKIAYLLLWPHARPIKLARPEPTLRAVANGAEVAAILASALQAAQASREATPVTEPSAAAPQGALAPA
ncbi:MAG: PH domain-containing protein [Phycisphaerales bacterium]|nr:PH domain-containing protein [Hyphomonadaceae bacterium]